MKRMTGLKMFMMLMTCAVLIPRTNECVAIQDMSAHETQELIRQMESINNPNYWEVVKRIEEIGIEARGAATLLLDRLKNSESPINFFAAVASIGPEIAPNILQGLQSDDLKYRRSLMRVVGEMGYDGASFVPQIVAMLEHPDREIRRVAIEILGEMAIEPTIVVPALIKRLDAPDRFEVASAARAIGNFHESAKEAADMLAEIALRIPKPDVRGDCYACRMSLLTLPKVDQTGEKLVSVVTQGLIAKDIYCGFDAWSFSTDSLEILYRRPIDYQQAEANLLTLLKSDRIRSEPLRYKILVILLARLQCMEALPIIKADLERELVPNGEEKHFGRLDEIPEFYYSTLIRVAAARSMIGFEPDNQRARSILLKAALDNSWSPLDEGIGKGMFAQDARVDALYGIAQMKSVDEATAGALQRIVEGRVWRRSPFDKALAWATASSLPSSREFLLSQFGGVLYDFNDEISPGDAARILGGKLNPEQVLTVIDAIFVAKQNAPNYNVEVFMLMYPNRLEQIIERGFHLLGKPSHWPDPQVGHRFYSTHSIQSALLRIAERQDLKFEMLESHLRSEHVNCRKTAIQMLGITQCDNPRVIPALTNALDDARAIVRMRAARVLGKYGAKAIVALPRLQELLNDDYYAVRKTSEVAIDSIVSSPSK
ncbi:MAG: HEAT repeat domain-containing protein [Planctomycetaceae bacterium]|nr:HEAT repeat domain-containing protein [Planctomycetaceae bacterium]